MDFIVPIMTRIPKKKSQIFSRFQKNVPEDILESLYIA
jgi:hypothetical protein